jgi:hypothetical protein
MNGIDLFSASRLTAETPGVAIPTAHAFWELAGDSIAFLKQLFLPSKMAL